VSLIDFVKLLCASAYTLLPYFTLFILTRSRNNPLSWTTLFTALPWALAAFTVVAVPFAFWSFKAYSIFHLFISTLSIAAILICRRRLTLKAIFPWLPAIIAGASLIPRIAPLLLYGNWMGSGDMRFHNMLAQSILEKGALPHTWLPFADIPVNYPLGIHLLAAFIAYNASLPVHTALTFLQCFCGALSTVLIYLISAKVFKSRFSAIISAASYGFIAMAGSLDYARWGGVPNAAAMMLVLLFVVELLQQNESDNSPGFSVLSCVLPAAVVFTHHYSALALLLLVAGLIMLSPLRRITLAAVTNTLAGFTAAAVLLLLSGSLPSASPDASIFVFHEQPISLLDAVKQLNPAFVVITCSGLFLILKTKISGATSIITSWITVYFLAFAGLEYCYRFFVFAASNGSEFYTALTPSRLIADSAYPLSLAAGALGLSPIMQKYRPHLLAILTTLAVIALLLLCMPPSERESSPDTARALEWIRMNTPETALIAGNIPHLEYRTWRKTTSPPIPASEARNHPSLVALRSLYSVDQFRKYATDHNVECFMILPSSHRPDPALSCVYSNESINVLKLENPNE
jgi:hypothetical protein